MHLQPFALSKTLSFLHGSGAFRHLIFFMAVTERDVQRVVDAMPVLEQRVAEIEKNASATQIVNQATVQTMRKEFTESCNNVVDQASAKFANIELQARELHETAKAIVDGAGQQFHNGTEWTIVMTRQDVDSAREKLRYPKRRVGIGGPLETRWPRNTMGRCCRLGHAQCDRREASILLDEDRYRNQQHNGCRLEQSKRG